MSLIRKIPSGLTGLDEYVLGGGFPEGRVVLVYGPPGVGKTIFAFQFLMKGVELGERCIYVPLDEPPMSVMSNMTELGWNVHDVAKHGYLIILGDLYPPMGRPFDEFLDRIQDAVENTGAKRLAVDSLSNIPRSSEQTPVADDIKNFFDRLRDLPVTSVVTCREGDPKLKYAVYEADGVIHMYFVPETSLGKDDLIVPRYIHVFKMRGTDVRSRRRLPYRIKRVNEPPEGVAIEADWTAGAEEAKEMAKIPEEERYKKLAKNLIKARMRLSGERIPAKKIAAYIRSIHRGATREGIARLLRELGYSEEEIEEALFTL